MECDKETGRTKRGNSSDTNYPSTVSRPGLSNCIVALNKLWGLMSLSSNHPILDGILSFTTLELVIKKTRTGVEVERKNPICSSSRGNSISSNLTSKAL